MRAHVDDLNARIRAAHRAPQVGPPFRVRVVDVEAVVEQWRADRPVPAPRPPMPSGAVPKRRWFRRTAI